MDTTNPHLERGRLLLSQGRHDLAEGELRQAIASDPTEPLCFALLSLCLLQREDWMNATAAAARAVEMDPNEAMYHSILGDVYTHRRMYKEARAAIEHSLRLDPTDPGAWGTLASIESSQSRHKEALAAAEKGLEIEPLNERCTNLRAIALTNLGKRSQAAEAIEGTLSRNPQNATSHANMGWTLLHQGQPRKALDHFREALRLEPGLEWARRGIMEAMKARNPIYRAFLAYFLFMSRLSGRGQWGIIIGGYIGIQLLRKAGGSNAALAPWVGPIIAAYIVFAIGTVVAVPLFNLFLLINRFGRHVLDRGQKIAAACFGMSILPGLTFLVLWATLGGDRFEASALVLGVWCLPVALAGLARPGRNRAVMTVVAGVLGAVCATSVLEFFDLVPGSAFMVALFGCVGSTFLSNVLATTAAPKRT